MRKVIRFIITFVMLCVVGFDARFAFASATAMQLPDPGGYNLAGSDFIAGSQKVVVGPGLGVETLVKDFQKDYDPSGARKLTWEEIYAANRDAMIPVCTTFVITDQVPEGTFKSLWTARGKAGEWVWTAAGCEPKNRTAWLVAGTTVTIPAKPIPTDAAKIAAFDDVNALKQRVAELEGTVSTSAVTTAPSATVVTQAEPEARPSPFVVEKVVMAPASPVAWNNAAFAALCAALCVVFACLYVARFRKRERALLDIVESTEMKRDSALLQVERTFVRHDELKAENDKLKKRITTLEVLAKCERSPSVIVTATAEAVPVDNAVQGPLTPRRLLAATQQDSTHVGHLLHVSLASYEARTSLIDFIRARGATVGEGVGISSLIGQALELADKAERPSANFLDQLAVWANGPERVQPIEISSSEHLMALDKLRAVRLKVSPTCFTSLWATQSLQQDPGIKAMSEELTIVRLEEFLELFHASSATHQTAMSHKMQTGTA